MKRPKAAFSLAELLISLGLLGLLMALIFLTMRQGVSLTKNVSGAEAVALQFKRIQRSLDQDLAESLRYEDDAVAVPPSLPGGGNESSAFWILSPRDPSDGEVVQDETYGSAFAMRNVLYYAVVPRDHSSCRGSKNALGFEDACRHKCLIRKLIDSPPGTSVGSEEEEELLTPEAVLGSYLTRPWGRSLSAMTSEPGLEKAQLLATQLLSFEVLIQPDPTVTGEVQFLLRGFIEGEANRFQRLGSESLSNSRYTLQYRFSIFPQN